MIRIILNGKKASLPSVRSAISEIRKEGETVEVRVTYEYGDIERFLHEALRDGIKRLVIGGGDGSVNEMVDALAKIRTLERPELAILPLGTANDFATACAIPLESYDALRLALFGTAIPVDIVQANERHFINVATAGFGAQVTAETPEELKNFLGGGAYTLTGVLKAIDFVPYRGKMKTPDFESDETGIVAAVCNGRQAGGGQLLAPKAYINDGLLDVVIVKKILGAELSVLLDEIRNPSHKGRYIKYFQTPWVESESEEAIPVNLDGEPYRNSKIRFEILPGALDLILPEHCPCIL